MRANGRKILDVLATAVLAAGVAAAVAFVPRGEWLRGTEPTTQAMYGFFVALAILAVARARGDARLERATLAVFLAGMAIVYLRAAVAAPGHGGGLVWLEVVGVVLFGSIAVGGYRRPPLLIAGIVAHGLAWDLWHLGSGPVSDWYAGACAVVDVSVGAYAASRLPAWSSGGGSLSPSG